MGKSLLAGFVAVLLLSLASTAKAQRAASSSSGAHSSASSAHSGSVHTGHSFSGVKLAAKPTGSRSVSTSSRAYLYKPNTTAPLPNSLPALGGLGFDCQNLGCNSNSATQSQQALASRFRRISGLTGVYLLGGGYYYPYDSDESQAEAPPEEAAQQPSQEAQQSAYDQAPAPPEAEPPHDPELIPDLGDFTLILKNGTEITAVAFTRRKDQLVYITSNGTRRTVNVADVDADATTKANEDRGTPFKLPI